MEEIIKNPLMILSLTILIGQIIGSFKYRHIKLGSSGTLFAGLFISYMYKSIFGEVFTVSKTVFLISLLGFIAAVGLTASKDIVNTIKKNGFKFIILGMTITGSGAVMTYLFMTYMTHPYKVIGTYLGALTSSPGLASAIELSGTMSPQIGLGYAISYVPGVLLVILFAQYMGKAKEKEISRSVSESEESTFSIGSFVLVILIGILLGQVSIKLSSSINISLGMTGGVLVSSLILGSIRNIAFMDFRFNEKQLKIIRDLSLNMFLAIVGLNYGYAAINAVKESGIYLLMVGLTTGFISISFGLLMGQYILKIDKDYLVGAICGGMTSTPGLAAAIDQFKEDKVVSGYGATYPFALIFMIVFTNILFIRS